MDQWDDRSWRLMVGGQFRGSTWRWMNHEGLDAKLGQSRRGNGIIIIIMN